MEAYWFIFFQIVKKAVYRSIERSLRRHQMMAKLHIFPEEEIPEEIKGNITHQIPVLRPVPRSLLTYTDEEIQNFPKIWDYPKDHVVR